MTRDADLLDDLRAEANRGRIYECSLKDPRWCFDGLQHGADIYIDPRPIIIEVFLHELLHRRHPKLGERAVQRTARHLVVSMTDAEKAAWWRLYRNVKKTRRPITVEDHV